MFLSHLLKLKDGLCTVTFQTLLKQNMDNRTRGHLKNILKIEVSWL